MKKSYIFLLLSVLALASCDAGIEDTSGSSEQGSSSLDNSSLVSEESSNANTEASDIESSNSESGNSESSSSESSSEEVSEPWVRTKDLFFSEYGEGSSENRYLELFNGTGSSLDLSSYAINLYANGATTPTNTMALSDSLADGKTYVIGGTHVSTALAGYCQVKNAVCNFNGDDVVTLTKDGEIIDIIGTIW